MERRQIAGRFIHPPLRSSELSRLALGSWGFPVPGLEIPVGPPLATSPSLGPGWVAGRWGITLGTGWDAVGTTGAAGGAVTAGLTGAAGFSVAALRRSKAVSSEGGRAALERGRMSCSKDRWRISSKEV